MGFPAELVSSCALFSAVLCLAPLNAYAEAKQPSTTEAPSNFFTQYAHPSTAGAPTLIGRFDLQPTSIGQDDVPALGKPKADRPNVYSGLTLDHSREPLTFVGMSDRGPVKACHDVDPCGKGFPWPHYSPSIYRLHILQPSNEVAVAQSCPLRFRTAPSTQTQSTVPAASGQLPTPISCTSAGRVTQRDAGPATGAASEEAYEAKEPAWIEDGVTGLPNTDNDEVPFDKKCSERLDRNPSGIDSEDVAQIPNSPYCVGADEYSPSVFVFNCDFDGPDCGVVLMRYVPEGIAPEQHDARYAVSEILPHALVNRRQSRGFESVAVSPDGKQAIAIMQSGMGDDDGVQKHSHTLMSVRLDISSPLNATLLGTHILLAKNAKTFVGDASGSWTRAKDIKVSAAVWASGYMGRGLDPVVLVLTRGVNQVLAQAVDYTYATDVTDALKDDALRFDSFGGHTKTHEALMRMNIVPAHVKTFFDSGDLSEGGTSNIAGVPDGVQWSDKQEGMVIVNNCTLAFGNDNDFKRSSELWVVQLNKCLSDGMESTAQSAAAILMRLGVVLGLALIVTTAVFYYGLRAADRLGEQYSRVGAGDEA